MQDPKAIVPTHDVGQAVEFLEFLDPPDPVIYTIGPDGLPHLRRMPGEPLVNVLAEHLNTYYSLAVPQKNLGKKAKKEELVSTRFLHVDLDPLDGVNAQDELARLTDQVTIRLPKGVPPPSAIVESGRGIQALWKLAEAVALPAEERSIESINLWLIDSFEAPPGTHNVDRILRLPGSWNALDKKKRDRGFVPRMAQLIEIFSPERLYTLDDFRIARSKVIDAQRPSTRERLHENQFRKTDTHVDADDIDDPVIPVKFAHKYFETHNLSLRVCWLIGRGTPSASLEDYERDYGPVPEGRNASDRSAWVYDVVCNMLRAKIPRGEILGVLTDRAWGISGHCLDDKDPEYAARRQIARALNTIAKDSPKDGPTIIGGTYPKDGEEPKPGAPVDPWEIERETRANWQFDSKKTKGGFEFNLPTTRNNLIALAKMHIRLTHDQFADRTLINGEPLQDFHVDRLWFDIESKYGFRVGTEVFHKLLVNDARDHSFHPVVDYFASLKWDGKPRLDAWLINYGGAQDSEYCRAVAALPLIAAVRRIKCPGAKFDEILTLVSAEQGTFKSTAIETLCPERDWYTDDLPLSAEAQQVIEMLQGHLIVECAETKGMKKGGDEHVKAFLSRRVDKARMAWGRITKQAPRQCVFIATSNDEMFLRDPTGNRRWWPVTITRFDTDRLSEDRDMLWAEAVHREAEGESIRLSPTLYGAAAEQQAARTIEDPFYDALASSLNSMWGMVLRDTIWDFLPNSGVRGHDAAIRVSHAMEKLGWKKSKQRLRGTPQNCFTRADPVTGNPGHSGEWIVAVEQRSGRALAAYESNTNTRKAF
jgi:hypothetical protein